MSSTVPVRIYKVDGLRQAPATDLLAVEEPLELQLRYSAGSAPRTQSVSVTMRTPGADKELSAGFLFTEGILHSPLQIAAIQEQGNKTLVVLAEGAAPVLGSAQRNFYTTSSCGVCGKASIDAIRTVSPFAPAPDALRIEPALFYSLPEALRAQQAVFNSTGGLHASALFGASGNFIALREDVGRHNALDKLIGAAFLEDRLPLREAVLLLSGRASFELVQKAAMAGIRVIAAIGAPSSLAVALAEDAGITLIGFLRGERMNVYTHERRVR